MVGIMNLKFQVRNLRCKEIKYSIKDQTAINIQARIETQVCLIGFLLQFLQAEGMCVTCVSYGQNPSITLKKYQRNAAFI